MALTDQDLQRLIRNARETMDVELKEWIDPESPEGRGKIARGCIALFNANGGYLIIGVQDNGRPAANAPNDVRTVFHPDVIQGIVSKYASQPIAIEVEFAEVESITYPIICVPSGVRTPCAAKSELRLNKDKALIKDQAIYVRSVNSNNVVSTTEPRIADWDRLIRICHDNREADIGAFLRRHLAGIDLDVLRNLLTPASPMPSLVERAEKFLTEGHERFITRMNARSLKFEADSTFEASILVEGSFPNQAADRDFYQRILLNRPSHTGWPFWIDLQTSDRDKSAYVRDNGWEALIQTHIMGEMLDFWRAEPGGRFYQLRGLEDDAHGGNRVEPGKWFDFALHIGRVAEVVSIGAHFARALGAEETTTSVAYACRFVGLKGRTLYSWSHPDRRLRNPGVAVQDVVTTSAVMPLESATFAPTVEKLIAPVLSLFDGTRLESRVIERVVSDVVNRRVN